MADESNVELSSLSFPSDPSKLPTGKEVPLGKLEFEIKSFSAGKTKAETDPEKIAKGKKGEKLYIKAVLSVTSPEDYIGMPYTQNFYIGSDNDQMAVKEATWKTNGTFLMSMLKESGVSLSASTKPVEALQAAVGQRVGGEVKVEKDKTGQYPDKHVVRKWFKPGTQPYGIVGDASISSAPMMQAPPAGLSTSD